MKRTLLLAVCIAITTMACNKENKDVTPSATTTSASTATTTTTHSAKRDANDNSLFISLEEANMMISSYVSSIDQNSADSFGPDVKSYTVNADSLRAILSDPNVKSIKISFAHTMDYINTGHKDQNAGYKAGALTLVITGYDAAGDYKHYKGMVLDHASPCPYTCAPGAAGAITF